MIGAGEIEIKKEQEKADLGKFVIGPLPAGYGTTLGTALRRTLLSSLPGMAVVEVSFSGVSHPFTTIKGVAEDVVEIILNLKKVRFSGFSEEPLEAKIEAKGKGSVMAEDIQVSSDVKVANPKQKIATLTSPSAKFSARLLIEGGVGYKTAEERERSRVGAIPMDSIFSPVPKVLFSVEEARRGRETNLDRLVMEITTDETIKPSEALEKAAQILMSYLSPLSGAKKEKASKETKGESAKVKEPSAKAKKTPLAELALPSQTVTILSGAGIGTVGDLVGKSVEEIRSIKGFGAKRVKELMKEIEKLGVLLPASSRLVGGRAGGEGAAKEG
jgi:DNA-directed RNA polymerase subunit alpha